MTAHKEIRNKNTFKTGVKYSATPRAVPFTELKTLCISMLSYPAMIILRSKTIRKILMIKFTLTYFLTLDFLIYDVAIIYIYTNQTIYCI